MLAVIKGKFFSVEELDIYNHAFRTFDLQLSLPASKQFDRTVFQNVRNKIPQSMNGVASL